MKNKIIFGLALCSLIGLALFQLGCKKIAPSNYSISVDTDVFSSPMFITFQNAKDGATNQPLDFTLTISGKDKDKILTSLGTTNFDVQEGWIALNLAKGVIASVEHPIEFIISATIPGFEPIRKEITVETNDEIKLDIKVIEAGNLPVGIAEDTSKFSLSSGVLAVAQELKTVEENGTTESVSLSFSAGTTMLDKSGNKISGSSVEAKVRYYGVTDQSIDVFPGGLNPQKVVDKNNKIIEGGVDFFTAGLMDIDMKIGGAEVKRFDKPVQASMQLNPSQDNFITGEPVKEGDKIPVWSLDESTGEWQQETEANVVMTSNGLVANFEIQHLSCWNLDWGWGMFGSNGTTNSKLDVKFDVPWTNASGNYEVTLRSPKGGYLGALHGASLFNGYVATFGKTPNIPQAYIQIYDNQTGKEVFKSDLFNPATKGAITVKISPPVSLQFIDVAISYALICTKNPKLKPNASAWLKITEIGNINNSQTFFTGITNNKSTKGQLNVRLINGKKYRVSTVGIDGAIISCEGELDINNLQFNTIKGLVVKKLYYDSNLKKVFVDCQYTTDKC